MAVRLQMKLGLMAEQDRLPGSPDTIVVVEPTVGAVARSKGHLYLLVTSKVPGNRAREATRLAAETIRNEYYYDESAGIRVCLIKAIATANKRLAHQRDRLGLGHAGDGAGPIGIGVAVVRGNELYVATVGPAEAYLIRQARLSTLPDPHRERGLPASELEPEVWRGEVSVGDSLVLISPNVVARLGPEELKDAMVTLHPQSAMEHLHHRFVAADGSGSDGAIAFEATEVASTHKQRTLVPVRPAEPLAGAPDRSPIPLADPVVDGVAAVQAGARQAREVAGNAFERAILRLQDVLPQRRAAYRRVTPISARRETQRRAAVAILAFIVVAFGLGLAVFVAGGASPRAPISSVAAGQRALDAARANLQRVSGPGVDLVEDAPDQALQLLTDAYEELDQAEEAKIPLSAIRPIREEVVAGLDRLYHVVDVRDEIAFQFDPAAKTPADLGALVLGPDGAPYVLDRANKAVWRINLSTGKATLVIRQGTKAAGATAAAPRLLSAGGLDLLVLDDRNVVWRFRVTDKKKGTGQLTRVRVNGAPEWGKDVIAIGTFIKIPEAGLYNFYVIDPSEKQILGYSPSADGSGFPARWTGKLSAPRAVDRMTSLYIDGDIFVTEGGSLVRFVSGNSDGWTQKDPGDDLLRGKPNYTLVTSGSDRRKGRLYAYDAANDRIVALDKARGDYIEQYRIAGDPEALADLRGMFVIDGANGEPATLYWLSRDGVHRTILEPIPPDSASPSAGPAASDAPAASGPASSGAPRRSAKP